MKAFEYKSLKCCGMLIVFIVFLANEAIFAQEFEFLEIKVPPGTVSIGDSVQLTVEGIRADGTREDISTYHSGMEPCGVQTGTGTASTSKSSWASTRACRLDVNSRN